MSEDTPIQEGHANLPRNTNPMTLQEPKSTMPWPQVDDALRERLAYGARERAEMQAQIERGEEPTGPRADWLHASAHRILGVVAEQCERFTAEHPEQAASLADALDMVWNTRTMLLAMKPKTTAGRAR
jgi:hypothetical protein